MKFIKLPELFESRSMKGFVIGVGVCAVIAVIFQAGLMVGFHKAHFSYQWGENYHRNFGGPRGGMMGDMMDKEFINGHGIGGKIIKIDGQSVIVSGREGKEMVVVVDAGTVIRRMNDTITINDLKVDDRVVVLGDPRDDGQVVAKLIRLIPPRPGEVSGAVPAKLPQ